MASDTGESIAMTVAAPASTGCAAASARSIAAGWYAVGVLWLGYICSFVDRQVLALVVDPVKASLGLVDTQLALLQGLAFGVFYAFIGLPCGALVDRYDRRRVIAAGIALWSVATAACAFATGFWTLFAARMLVGVGEATLSPGALSLLSDYFPRERRVLPLSVYVSAGAFGGGLAMVAGGAAIAYVAAHPYVLPGGALLEGWRAAFVIVGLPGIVIAALVMTLREPERRRDGISSEARTDRAAAWRFMCERRSLYLRHYGGFVLFAVLAYATLSWAPTYFIRVHGWTLPEAGWRFGMTFLIAGSLGAVLGGAFAARLRRRHRDGNLRAAAVATAAIILPSVVAPLVPDANVALALYGVALFFTAFPSGASSAAITEAAPSELRGQISAVYYLVMSVVGLTCGPLSVALLTDHLFVDPQRLGTSLAIVATVVAPCAALLVWSALPEFRRWVPT